MNGNNKHQMIKIIVTYERRLKLRWRKKLPKKQVECLSSNATYEQNFIRGNPAEAMSIIDRICVMFISIIKFVSRCEGASKKTSQPCWKLKPKQKILFHRFLNGRNRQCQSNLFTRKKNSRNFINWEISWEIKFYWHPLHRQY